MKDVLNFIIANKEVFKLLAYLLISVISTIIVVALKKKRVLNELDLILLKVFEKLPDFINQAELLKGPEVKKEFVLECIKQFVKENFSVNLAPTALNCLMAHVEKILSTPQKHS